MKHNHFLILAISIIAMTIAGCTRPERIIDNSVDEWKILATTDAAPSALALLRQPDGEVTSSDVFAKTNGSPLPGKVTKIIEFRENLYLLIPSAFQIIVVNRDYKQVASIDLSTSQRIPSDIAFGNATTAYIAHENDTTVSVLDIVNFTVARSITVGKRPIAIAAIGNQIFVANQASNTVSQIDTRTNTVVATHQVPTAPTFIQPNIKNGHEVLVLSLGAGKIDSEVKTAAAISFIDSARIITKVTTLDDVLNGGSIDGHPVGMAISTQDWAFIAVQNGVIRFDIRDQETYTLELDQKFTGIFYNFRRDELLLLNNTEGTITNGLGEKKEVTFTLPFTVTSILGL